MKTNEERPCLGSESIFNCEQRVDIRDVQGGVNQRLGVAYKNGFGGYNDTKSGHFGPKNNVLRPFKKITKKYFS